MAATGGVVPSTGPLPPDPANGDTDSGEKHPAIAPAEGSNSRRKKRRGFSNPEGEGSPAAAAAPAPAAAAAPTGATVVATPSAPVASEGLLAAPSVPAVAPHIAAANRVVEAARAAASAPPPMPTDGTPKLMAMRQFAMTATVAYRKQLDQLRIECNPLMAQQHMMAKRQAFISLGRIFVGGLNQTTTQEMLKMAFEPFGTLRAIELPLDPTTGSHKGFGFLDYDHPEAAEMAITQMNLQQLDGRQIKVNRPPATAIPTPIVQQILSDERNKTRIYVSSIFSELAESDIRTVFEAFGGVLSCIMCPDPANSAKHRGFGFIEFESEGAAVEAVAAMHNFDLAGHYLRVCKAITLPDFVPWLQRKTPSAAAVAAAAAAAAVTKAKGIGGAESTVDAAAATPTAAAEPKSEAPTTLEQDENIGISGTQQRFMMMQKLAEKTGSRVVVLRNMVGKEDIDETLESEVQEECEKNGTVEKVLIYEETNESTGESIVKIFVRFDTNGSARGCIKALNGRFFGGRVVVAEEYDEDRYSAKDYTG